MIRLNTTTKITPVIASTKNDNCMMECAGVDSGAKMLVVSDMSPLSAAERVGGTRTKAAIKNSRGEMSVLPWALSSHSLTRFGSTSGFMRVPVIHSKADRRREG